RIALEVTYPDTYIDIISNLAVNAMLLHTGDMITPDVTIDYLTLDDDNGDIYDGTPHYPEICEGFNAHSMECPQLRLIEFIYPDGHPDLINPEGTTIRVEVQGFLQEPVPGTGMLYYSTGDEWTSVAMVEVSNNVYDAVFPVIECGYEVSFYFSADTDQGTTVYDPWNAPSASYAAFSAFGLETLFYDDFEYDEGWEVVNDCLDGQWDRGEPVGGGDRGDPPSDYDESGSCFLTDNQYGNSDVDDGYTYLISPTFDLTDKETMIQYALWYTNFAGDNPQSDVFITYISDDNGESWIEAEEIGPQSETGWHIHSFAVNNLITPNDQVRIRFEASDLGGGSVVEAGIDAFEIIEMDCGPTSVQPGVNENQIPLQYALRGCYPNPFNATTNISYELPATGQVTLEIFNVMGQKVTTLINGSVEAGRHNISWDASSFTSGIYFYKLEAGDRTFTKRMTLLK
ncbi:MAG: T9SS type A sorting domain-containing protein, partial [candidate division Zixibacteria bacterium]|nr:T9SS type A sorting domain-containing protein [candidate division Zixibacteria bacterium]